MRIEPSSSDISTTRSTIWKYSSLIRRSCALGGDEVVDAGAQILEDEILLGRRLALVDFLRPLLQRQLDAERLVDGKGDVEKIQAVDFEIVDGVAFRLDLLPRNVAGFGNDIRNRIECIGHLRRSWCYRLGRTPRNRVARSKAQAPNQRVPL